MTINRPEITHAHLLEQNRATETATAFCFDGGSVLAQTDFGERTFETFLRFVGQLQSQITLRQFLQETLEIPGQLVVRRIADELVEVTIDRPDVLRDAPLVVVENADELLRR